MLFEYLYCSLMLFRNLPKAAAMAIKSIDKRSEYTLAIIGLEVFATGGVQRAA